MDFLGRRGFKRLLSPYLLYPFIPLRLLCGL